MRKDNDGYEEKYTAGVINTKVGYSIKFTRTNADRLYDEGCVTEDNKEKFMKAEAKREAAAQKEKAIVNSKGVDRITFFYVQQEGWRHKITCDSYTAWRDAKFDDLVEFGHMPTLEEKQNRSAAKEVFKARQLAASSDASIADELDKAKERQRSGVPYS